jgi:hypothetical protein
VTPVSRRRATLLVAVAAGLLATGTTAVAPRPAGAATPPAVAKSLSVSSPAVHTAATDGHPTNPVWFHDSVAATSGSTLYLAWTTDQASVQARAWSSRSGWLDGPVTVSVTALNCGCVDSTGTNPNRHDVPGLFTDPAGRLYAVYGGGTAAKTVGSGPYFRSASRPGSATAWLGESRLPVPGALYDFQVAREASGDNLLIGQQGDNSAGAGSLGLLRLTPGTATAPGTFDTFGQPYRILVQGGTDPNACAWQSQPGCDIFVIGSLSASAAKTGTTQQRLYLTWNWAEGNLADTCGDPAGFCDKGLYAAYSDDGGQTWSNLAGTVRTSLLTGPIRYDDPNYQLVGPATDVGLFKQVAVNGGYPGVPWIAYQPGADTGHGQLVAGHWAAGRWSTITLDSSRSWNNHLVLRSTPTQHLYLWSDIAQSGSYADDLRQWVRDPATGAWSSSLLRVGPNWFLTGTRWAGSEALVWRAPGSGGATDVRFSTIPVR